MILMNDDDGSGLEFEECSICKYLRYQAVLGGFEVEFEGDANLGIRPQDATWPVAQQCIAIEAKVLRGKIQLKMDRCLYTYYECTYFAISSIFFNNKKFNLF